MSLDDVLNNRQQWHLETADALDFLKEIPAGTVHCVCTSPPY